MRLSGDKIFRILCKLRDTMVKWLDEEDLRKYPDDYFKRNCKRILNDINDKINSISKNFFGIF